MSNWSETRLNILRTIRELPEEERVGALAIFQEIDETMNEFEYDVTNAAVAALKGLADEAQRLQVTSPEKAADLKEEVEDYVMGLPEVQRRLALKYDEDEWLAKWLTRHPDFINTDLNGQVPPWINYPNHDDFDT